MDFNLQRNRVIHLRASSTVLLRDAPPCQDNFEALSSDPFLVHPDYMKVLHIGMDVVAFLIEASLLRAANRVSSWD
jgi:hypothetical protein